MPLSGIMAVSSNPNMREPVKALCDKFRQAFELFGTCDRAYNGKVMDEESIEKLGMGILNVLYVHMYLILFVDLDIKRFMAFNRENFPRASFPTASVLPKVYLLECHMVEWLRKYHLGTGFMGEQGAESIHAHLNRLENTYATIPNKLDRLKHVCC